MTDIQEKRIHERETKKDLWIEVFPSHDSTSSTAIIARVDNLSEGGVCLISDYAFELGQIIRFPKSMPFFSGTVVWTCQSKLECKAGVQFIPNK